jgi:hypothetical protein
MYKIIFSLLFVFLFGCNITNKSDTDIHINFIINDLNYYNFTRMVFFPKEKITLLVFYNPESYLEENPEKLNNTNIDFKKYQDQKNDVEKKVKIFNKITQKNENFYLRIDRDNFIRFINFINGIKIFLPSNLELENTDYLHIKGDHTYFGENLYEFFTLNERYESGSYHIISQNKHFRFETMMLNLIFQLKFKEEILQKQNQLDILYSFFNTNLSKKDFQNFLETLVEYDFLIVEAPLIPVKFPTNSETDLFVHIPKSKELYNHYLNKIKSNNILKDPITLEILNASGINRLANRVKAIIDSQNYKVLATDNFSFDLDETFLICNNGNSLELKQLIGLLYIPEKNIYFLRRIKDVGFTYILGHDFNVKKFLKR